MSARMPEVGDRYRFKNDTVEIVEFIPALDHFGGVSAVRYAWLTEIDVDPAIREHSSREEGRLIGLARAAEFVRTANLVVAASTGATSVDTYDGTEAEFEPGNPVLVDDGRTGRVTSVHDGLVWVSVKDPLVNTGWRPANGYEPSDVQHVEADQPDPEPEPEPARREEQAPAEIPQRITGATTTPSYADAPAPVHTFQYGDIVTVAAGNHAGSLAVVVPPEEFPRWIAIKDTPQAPGMVCLSFGTMAGLFIHAQHLTLHTSATALAAREVPGALGYTIALFADGWDGPRLDSDGEGPGRYTLAEALVLVDAYRRSDRRWPGDRVELAAIVVVDDAPPSTTPAEVALPVIGDTVLLHNGMTGRVTARGRRHDQDCWDVRLNAPENPLHGATVRVTLDQIAGYPEASSPTTDDASDTPKDAAAARLAAAAEHLLDRLGDAKVGMAGRDLRKAIRDHRSAVA